VSLEVRGIQLGYDQEMVVRGLDFRLSAGEIGCLLGPSGCGKTTALRAIAGFEPLSAGEIRIGGKLASAVGRTVLPEKRSVGMVFQDHALFPHLTVDENVGFGLHRLSGKSRRTRVTELLRLVGLDGLEDRYPHELSGGQQQRIALARALAPEPAVMLLDEPFSNLDTGLRRQMGEDVRSILKTRGTATLLVTHDQQEAFTLADQVGLMYEGRLLQWDSPYLLYHQPACRYVAGFTGRGSYLKARVAGGRLEHVLGPSELPDSSLADGEELELLIRPDDIKPEPDGFPARVVSRQFQGAEIFYRLALKNGEEIGALFTSHNNFAVDETIGIRLDARHMIVFSTDGTDGIPTPPENQTNPEPSGT